jgi:hypothetical protein
MTPVRALFASLLAAILLGAGAFIVARAADARPHDLAPLLSIGRSPFSLLCFLAAWGAIVSGALGVLAAFLAFIAPEEDDDPRIRRRGFPKAAPLVLVAIALALIYLALRCASAAPVQTPIPVPVAPAPADAAAETPLLGEVPPETAPAPEVPPVISPVTDNAAFEWRYKYPLLRGNSPVWDNVDEPFADQPETARLLCGRAWVAVTGSASEEGPPDRNAARARIRTGRAVARAQGWLSRHPDCGPTVVLGVDLGQHAPVARVSDIRDDGAASAYQRQILVVSRLRRAPAETLSVDAAVAELGEFLSNPADRTALYAGRVFPQEPEILRP